MLQYILTTLAGVAIGIAGMRIWVNGRSVPTTVASMADTSEAPLADGPAAPAGGGIGKWLNTRNLLLAAALLVFAGVIVMTQRDPAGETVPVPGDGGVAASGSAAAGLADVDTMIGRLEARLKASPGDGEGWRMLGWSQLMTGHPDRALEPYRKAMTLLPGNASVHEGYGEALAAVAGGTVTPEARAAIDKALALDPQEPRARYLAGKWLAQQGRSAQALDQWITLANSGPADAPWQADVRRDIAATAKSAGIDIGGRLKPAAAIASAPVPSAPASGGTMPPVDPAVASAANAMAPAEREAMIGGMVERLANRLRANPADPEGWNRLLRSRMVLHQDGQARSDLTAARKALAGNPAGLALVDGTARELGIATR